jgi:hypothetical protein
MRLGEIPRARQLGLGQRKTSQEFLGKDFSWRNWENSSCCSVPMLVSRSMVINDLNTVCVTLDPLEDHTPLIVAANRVVPLKISMQLLESVCWRHQEIIEAGNSINHGKFSFGWPCYPLELTNEALIEQVLGTPVAKRPDHAALNRIPICVAKSPESGVSGRLRCSCSQQPQPVEHDDDGAALMADDAQGEGDAAG